MIVVLFAIGLLTAIYLYYKQIFTYWLKKGLPQLNPTIPYGDMKNPWTVPRVIQFDRCYQELKKRGEKHGGIYLFARPVYMVIDPEYVKNILVKDFQHFTDRGLYYNEKKQPISANLFFIEGQRWRNLRHRLTPTFTSGKMKMMFKTMLRCTEPLASAFKEMASNREAIDIKESLARFTTDVIGSCAFGIECNSFLEPNSEFRQHGKAIFHQTPFDQMKLLFVQSFPNLSRSLGIVLLNNKSGAFLTNMATETYNYRKRNNVRRDDFMQILIDLKDKKGDPKDKENSITMNELIAQASLFFIAGFDTSSVTLSFTLFNLASHLDIQEKVRNEVKDVLKMHKGEVTYEALQDMKYTEQVIDETMRMYPIAAILGRVCTEDYRIPSTDIVIEKGTSVIFSPWALHRDPEHFPDPEKFDPDRFSAENKGNIVPGTYFPFGDGPRTCIGLRFAMMQMKIALAVLLVDYEFTLNLKTKLPLEIDFGFILTPKGGIWLDAKTLS
ncbi:Cyp6a9 [Trypoxylus dichotomus]